MEASPQAMLTSEATAPSHTDGHSLSQSPGSHGSEASRSSSSSSFSTNHDAEKAAAAAAHPSIRPFSIGTFSARPFSFNPKHWTLKMRILACTGLLLALGAIATAITVPLVYKQRDQPPPVQSHLVHPPPTTLIANNAPITIMPLGASITYGWLSTDGNGYREDLQGLFRRGGNTAVTFVGSRHNGTMPNNAVEGWPGYRIDQVWLKASVVVPAEQPTLVLLNVGTNDCGQNWNLNATTRPSVAHPAMTDAPTDSVGSRMRILLDDLFLWAPNTTVVVSTLIFNQVAAINNRVDYANREFRGVVAAMQAKGRRILLADMSAAAGGPNATTMSDVTHPNDVGYALMANKWYEAVAQAGDQGLLMV